MARDVRALLRSLPLAAPAALFSLTVGCGGSGSGGTHVETRAASTTLAELVPTDAVVFAHAPSFETLQSAYDLLRVELPSLEPLDVAFDLGREIEVDSAAIDRTLPVALVVWIEDGMRPGAAFLLPASDPARLAASEPKSVVRGNYVAVPSPDSTYVPGGAQHPLARTSDAGQVDVEVDLAKLVEIFRPMIDSGLAEMESEMSAMPSAGMPIDVAAMFEPYLRGARKIVDSVDRLHASVDVGAERWELSMEMTVREGSPLATIDFGEPGDLNELVPYADLEAPFAMLMQVDFEQVADAFQGMLQGMTSMSSMFDDMDELLASYDGAVAMMYDYGESGIFMSTVTAAKDADAVLETQLAMLRNGGMEEFGVTYEELGVEEVEGVEIHRVAGSIDEDAAAAGDVEAQSIAMMSGMLGPGWLRYGYAAEDGRVLTLMGDDKAAIARAAARLRVGGAEVPPDLRRALDALDGAPAGGVMRIDVARLLLTLRGFSQSMFGGPAFEPTQAQRDASAPLTLVVTAAPEAWGLRVSFTRDPKMRMGDLVEGL